MSRIRKETVITYDRTWATPEGERSEIDVVLPQTATDWMITEYDGSETLYIVEHGKIKRHEGNNFVICREEEAG